MKKILYVFLLCSSSVWAQKTLIHCGSILDTRTGKMTTKQTIVVEKNRILAVENGFTKATGSDKEIDLSSQTVLPGLIDMHVHLESETSKDQYIKRMSMTASDIAFEAQKNGMTTLTI